ncbi:MAG: transposase [Deltaproteobacteria bacterium]|nr:transposase [Deltaproteobacteria bacterium]
MQGRTEYKNRKEKRPFSPSQAMHVTLRSQIAKGPLSLCAPGIRSWLRSYIPQLARNLGIRLYHFSINGAHLHFVLQTKEKANLSRFLRVLSGMIARRVLKAEKGRGKGVSFWESRPFSRILHWGRDFKNVLKYVERNVLEAARKIPYARNCLADPKMDMLISKSLALNRLNRQSWCDLQMLLFQ